MLHPSFCKRLSVSVPAMDFTGGQKPPPRVENKSLWVLVWKFSLELRGGKKKNKIYYLSNLAMNSQGDTSMRWHLSCCLAGAAVWKDKAMAEPKLLHLSATHTLPQLQDSPAIPSVRVGSKVQDRTDQQLGWVNLCTGEASEGTGG